MAEELSFQGDGSNRLPPQNIEAEEAILGGILLDPEAISRVSDRLLPEAFYISAHKDIYQAAVRLHAQGKPTDLLSVTSWLTDHEILARIGGRNKLATLVDRTVSAVNIDALAGLVMEKYLRRQLIKAGNEIVHLGYETETELPTVLDQAEQKVFGVTQERPQSGLVHISDTLINNFQDIEDRNQGIALPGIPCGFYDLDAMTSGFQRSDLIIVAGRPSMGKCLGRGTNVVMFDGTLKPVESVVVGDLLMGDDSTPRRVLSLARGQEMMYWVKQKRGVDYRVNESHILSLKRSRNGVNCKHGDILNIPVKDYLEKSVKFKSNYKGYKVEVDFEEQVCPVEPYFLGLWLGDGSSSKVEITNPELVIAQYLSQYADRLGLNLREYAPINRCLSYSITKARGTEKTVCVESLQSKLRSLNVLDNKHIPQLYLSNSKKVRLDLLAGLLDTDGYYDSQHNVFEITQKNSLLAFQIKLLCDSLGFGTSIVPKNATIKSTGFSGQYYRLRIFGNLDSIPTRVERKQARPLKTIRDWRVTGIEVVVDKVDEYFGFMLDGNSLFLLEDMTVTHNTAFCLNLAHNIAASYKLPVAVFSLEMSKEQLTQRLLASEAQIESSYLRTGRLSQTQWEPLSRAIGILSEMPIYIDDTPNITVTQMRSQARRLQAEVGTELGLIVIDYLQLMEGAGDNRVQELSKITRQLKGLARELSVPVIALSQLSRGVEARTNKRPMLSDLRESGCLAGDSLITLAQGGLQIPIRELVGKSGFTVWALNKATMQLEKAIVSNAFSTGIKPLFTLTTRLGRKIRATSNHKFLTINGWKRLDELAPKEHLCLPRHLPSPGKQTMTYAEVALLGHLIGDGCTLPRHAIQYTTREIDLAQNVAFLAREVFGDSIVQSSKLVTLAKSDVYWDEILSIEYSGEEEVFDLTVPGLHNFVANNIIVHNSIEQDADLVIMLYRDEYYSPDTPDRGIAEVIIAKHRNGPTGTAKLLFNPQFTKFQNLKI